MNPLIENIARAALAEDLGRRGDITSAAVIAPDLKAKATLVARDEGRLAGLEIAKMVFELVDSKIDFIAQQKDGAALQAGAVIAEVHGAARSILAAERVALNFLTHLSGIASATAMMVKLAGPNTHLSCTRKTTPGLRILEKQAVRLGGGYNHRFGLDDGVLIKDNHLMLSASLSEAVRRAKAEYGHMIKIEVEIDRLDMIDEVLKAGADAVLLDNMSSEQLRAAVKQIDGRAITEASGRITPENVAAIAASGVDVISSGWLTHSAPGLDIGLDIVSV